MEDIGIIPTLLRISGSGFVYSYYVKLPAMIARLIGLTGGVGACADDGLSEHVVANKVFKMIAAAVVIRNSVIGRSSAMSPAMSPAIQLPSL